MFTHSITMVYTIIIIIYRLTANVEDLQKQIKVITEDRRDLQRRYDEIKIELEEKERILGTFAELNRRYYEQALRAELPEESTTPEGEEEEDAADEVTSAANSLSALSTNEKPSEADPSVPTSQDNTIPTVVESAGKSEEDSAE